MDCEQIRFEEHTLGTAAKDEDAFIRGWMTRPGRSTGSFISRPDEVRSWVEFGTDVLARTGSEWIRRSHKLIEDSKAIVEEGSGTESKPEVVWIKGDEHKVVISPADGVVVVTHSFRAAKGPLFVWVVVYKSEIQQLLLLCIEYFAKMHNWRKMTVKHFWRNFSTPLGVFLILFICSKNSRKFNKMGICICSKNRKYTSL